MATTTYAANVPVNHALPMQQASTTAPHDLKQRRQSAAPCSNANVDQQPQPLPVGWIEMRDPDGRAMFVNTANGQTSWQRPVMQMLPPGWQQSKTPEGRAIFIHPATGTLSYQCPSNETAQPATIPPRVVVQRSATALPKIPAPVDQKVVRRSVPRSVTAPATGSATVNMSIDMGAAMKTIPGMQQAHMVHQLSENNNVKLLSQKLASDVAETTITAASLATRQAKVVGKTMVSPKKMQRFSKKIVVQSGAFTVKAGRACKVMMNEMVDAADGKGKYGQKKVRRYVAYNPEGVSNGSHSPRTSTGNITSTSITLSASQQNQHIARVSTFDTVAQGSLSLNVSKTVPARQPVRKPVPSHVAALSVTNPQTTNVHKPMTAGIEALQAQQVSYQSLADVKPVFKPRPSIHGAQYATHPLEKPSADAASVQFQVDGQIQMNAGMTYAHIANLQQQACHQSSGHSTDLMQPQMQPSISPTAEPPSYQHAIQNQPNNSVNHPPRPTNAQDLQPPPGEPAVLVQAVSDLNINVSTNASSQSNQSHSQEGSTATAQALSPQTQSPAPLPQPQKPEEISSQQQSQQHTVQPNHSQGHSSLQPQQRTGQPNHSQGHSSQQTQQQQYSDQQLEPQYGPSLSSFAPDNTASAPQLSEQQPVQQQQTVQLETLVQDQQWSQQVTAQSSQIYAQPQGTVPYIQDFQYPMVLPQPQQIYEPSNTQLCQAPQASTYQQQLVYDQTMVATQQPLADPSAMHATIPTDQVYMDSTTTTTSMAMDPSQYPQSTGSYMYENQAAPLDQAGESIVYEEKTYVDTGDAAYAEAEIIYVDENGNELYRETAICDQNGEIAYAAEEHVTDLAPEGAEYAYEYDGGGVEEMAGCVLGC